MSAPTVELTGEPMFRVPQVAARADVSVWTVYRAIARGELAVARIGTAIRVPASALNEYLSGKKAA